MRQQGFKIVQNEDRFQVPAEHFGIGPSTTGYTLQWSADGQTWDDADTVSEGKSWPVTFSTPSYYFKLKGNVGTVKVVF